MSYKDTFIQIATDSNATQGTAPKPRGSKKTVPMLQFELLNQAPYEYTQDDIIFAIHLERQGLANLSEAEKEALWAEMFTEPHPCFRTSSLTKRFGWGVHYDATGKMAIYSVDSPEYANYASEKSGLTQLTAFRSRRK